ncbi:MAG: 16S rRNA methyltransferase [Promethearchaeota archaeon]
MKPIKLSPPPRLRLVLAQSALELVPRELLADPSVVADARRRGKKAREVLLDASLHQSAMKSLPGRRSRGRPDIVHFFLLSVLGTPLNFQGRLELVVHARGDRILHIHPEVRLPRSQDRFKGIVEGLFQRSGGTGVAGGDFLELTRGSLGSVVGEAARRPGSYRRVIVLARDGRPPPALREEFDMYIDLCRRELEPNANARANVKGNVKAKSGSPAPSIGPMTVVVGGFQTGTVEDDRLGLPPSVNLTRLSLGPHPLDAWTAGARATYLFEQRLLDESS